MANLRKWSTTATANASIAGGATTINFSEGQAPGTVNNSAREMMAQIRSVYTPDEWGWIEHSATASVASQTSFKLSGDQTTHWTTGRRWRIKSPSTTRYGAVVSASYTSETTVTVTVDSGSLSASHSIAALASITSNHIPANTYITSASLATALGTYLTSASAATALGGYVTSDSMSAAIANFVTSNSASAMIATQIAAGGGGGAVVLGTINTSSGSSATLTSLVLTDYKVIELLFMGVSHDNVSGVTILAGNSTSDDVAVCNSFTNSETVSGFVKIDLADGKGVSMVSTNTAGNNVGIISFDTALSTATTTISLAPSSGNFDAGSVRVIGYK
jgi:hypothetical protein